MDGYRRGSRGGYWHHRCPGPQPRPTVPSPPACRPLEIIEYPVTLSAGWANVVEAARRGRGSTPSAVVRCHRASETIVAGEWSGPSALADPDPISVHPDAVDPHVGGRSRPGLCWLVVDDPTKRPKRHYFHWRPGFHPGREMPQKQPIPTMECKAADPTQSHRDPQLEGRVPPRPEGNDSIGGPGSTRAQGRGGTHPSMSAQRLRGREALGVRPLAGAFGPLHCARRPTTPLLPSTNDRMGCSADYIAHSRPGFHSGPCSGAAASHRTPRAAATRNGASEVAQGIKCAPAAKFRKKSLSDVCAGKLWQ